jgi:lichenan operon transcriptional antiterminator
MRIYNDQALMLMVLFDSSQPVNGAQMSQILGVGVKTVKKEIGILNGLCQENGCFITSITGSGYVLSISDQQKFARFYRRVTFSFHHRRLYRNEQAERVHAILRTVLTQRGGFVPQIAAECHCSASTISRDMKLVRQRLDAYGLKLCNRTNRGMTLEGSEWDIRLAILNEEYRFRTMENTTVYPRDEAFAKLFGDYGVFYRSIPPIVEAVLAENDYVVPYNFLQMFINGILLTGSLHSERAGLKADAERLYRYPCQRQRDIVKQIFARLDDRAVPAPEDEEIQAAAVYLRAVHSFSYDAFLETRDHARTAQLAADFLDFLGQFYDIENVDTTTFRMDLCCQLTELARRCEYNIHLNSQDTVHLLRDGITTLDMCALLGLYLRHRSDIACSGNDLAGFYYIFAGLMNGMKAAHLSRALLISRDGYYCSRNLADRFRASADAGIEVRPLAYLDLAKTDLTEYQAIITDISRVRNSYSDRINVIDLHYFRRSGDLTAVQREILYTERQKQDFFRPEDLYYADDIRSMADVRQFIRDRILLPGEDADLYLSMLDQRSSVFSPRRNYQLLLMNTIGDILGRNFLKVIILTNSFVYEDSPVNKIVVYNLCQGQIVANQIYVNAIAALLHTFGFLATYDRYQDYQQLRQIFLP